MKILRFALLGAAALLVGVLPLHAQSGGVGDDFDPAALQQLAERGNADASLSWASAISEEKACQRMRKKLPNG
ncbi:hypothetical protein [Verrucomicrobium spinosum]|uniref:hypothetical protein n=1 Tax=Verrucomicrobium spinosum TaxID=2736 RepID=UPI001C46E9EC|nr:hypothetical protein [Verrucomicrobium spinosum]